MSIEYTTSVWTLPYYCLQIQTSCKRDNFFYLFQNKRAKLKNTLFLSKFNWNEKMHRLIMPAFIDLINACTRIWWIYSCKQVKAAFSLKKNSKGSIRILKSINSGMHVKSTIGLCTYLPGVRMHDPPRKLCVLTTMWRIRGKQTRRKWKFC